MAYKQVCTWQENDKGYLVKVCRQVWVADPPPPAPKPPAPAPAPTPVAKPLGSVPKPALVAPKPAATTGVSAAAAARARALQQQRQLELERRAAAQRAAMAQRAAAIKAAAEEAARRKAELLRRAADRQRAVAGQVASARLAAERRRALLVAGTRPNTVLGRETAAIASRDPAAIAAAAEDDRIVKQRSAAYKALAKRSAEALRRPLRGAALIDDLSKRALASPGESRRNTMVREAEETGDWDKILRHLAEQSRLSRGRRVDSRLLDMVHEKYVAPAQAVRDQAEVLVAQMKQLEAADDMEGLLQLIESPATQRFLEQYERLFGDGTKSGTFTPHQQILEEISQARELAWSTQVFDGGNRIRGRTRRGGAGAASDRLMDRVQSESVVRRPTLPGVRPIDEQYQDLEFTEEVFDPATGETRKIRRSGVAAWLARDQAREFEQAQRDQQDSIRWREQAERFFDIEGFELASVGGGRIELKDTQMAKWLPDWQLNEDGVPSRIAAAAGNPALQEQLIREFMADAEAAYDKNAPRPNFASDYLGVRANDRHQQMRNRWLEGLAQRLGKPGWSVLDRMSTTSLGAGAQALITGGAGILALAREARQQWGGDKTTQNFGDVLDENGNYVRTGLLEGVADPNADAAYRELLASRQSTGNFWDDLGTRAAGVRGYGPGVLSGSLAIIPEAILDPLNLVAPAAFIRRGALATARAGGISSARSLSGAGNLLKEYSRYFSGRVGRDVVKMELAKVKLARKLGMSGSDALRLGDDEFREMIERLAANKTDELLRSDVLERMMKATGIEKNQLLHMVQQEMPAILREFKIYALDPFEVARSARAIRAAAVKARSEAEQAAQLVEMQAARKAAVDQLAAITGRPLEATKLTVRQLAQHERLIDRYSDAAQQYLRVAEDGARAVDEIDKGVADPRRLRGLKAQAIRAAEEIRKYEDELDPNDRSKFLRRGVVGQHFDRLREWRRQVDPMQGDPSAPRFIDQSKKQIAYDTRRVDGLIRQAIQHLRSTPLDQRLSSSWKARLRELKLARRGLAYQRASLNEALAMRPYVRKHITRVEASVTPHRYAPAALNEVDLGRSLAQSVLRVLDEAILRPLTPLSAKQVEALAVFREAMARPFDVVGAVGREHARIMRKALGGRDPSLVELWVSLRMAQPDVGLPAELRVAMDHVNTQMVLEARKAGFEFKGQKASDAADWMWDVLREDHVRQGLEAVGALGYKELDDVVYEALRSWRKRIAEGKVRLHERYKKPPDVRDAIFHDTDPYEVMVKQRVLAEHGVSIFVYDELRGVLRTDLLRARAARELLPLAEARAVRWGIPLREAMKYERRVAARREAARNVEEFAAQPGLRGLPPETKLRAYEERMMLDDLPVKPDDRISAYQQQALRQAFEDRAGFSVDREDLIGRYFRGEVDDVQPAGARAPREGEFMDLGASEAGVRASVVPRDHWSMNADIPFARSRGVDDELRALGRETERDLWRTDIGAEAGPPVGELSKEARAIMASWDEQLQANDPLARFDEADDVALTEGRSPEPRDDALSEEQSARRGADAGRRQNPAAESRRSSRRNFESKPSSSSGSVNPWVDTSYGWHENAVPLDWETNPRFMSMPVEAWNPYALTPAAYQRWLWIKMNSSSEFRNLMVTWRGKQIVTSLVNDHAQILARAINWMNSPASGKHFRKAPAEEVEHVARPAEAVGEGTRTQLVEELAKFQEALKTARQTAGHQWRITVPDAWLSRVEEALDNIRTKVTSDVYYHKTGDLKALDQTMAWVKEQRKRAAKAGKVEAPGSDWHRLDEYLEDEGVETIDQLMSGSRISTKASKPLKRRPEDRSARGRWLTPDADKLDAIAEQRVAVLERRVAELRKALKGGPEPVEYFRGGTEGRPLAAPAVSTTVGEGVYLTDSASATKYSVIRARGEKPVVGRATVSVPPDQILDLRQGMPSDLREAWRQELLGVAKASATSATDQGVALRALEALSKPNAPLRDIIGTGKNQRMFTDLVKSRGFRALRAKEGGEAAGFEHESLVVFDPADVVWKKPAAPAGPVSSMEKLNAALAKPYEPGPDIGLPGRPARHRGKVGLSVHGDRIYIREGTSNVTFAHEIFHQFWDDEFNRVWRIEIEDAIDLLGMELRSDLWNSIRIGKAPYDPAEFAAELYALWRVGDDAGSDVPYAWRDLRVLGADEMDNLGKIFESHAGKVIDTVTSQMDFPPLTNRSRYMKWMEEQGRFSPRTADAIRSGERVWTVVEERAHFRSTWRIEPDWVNEDVLRAVLNDARLHAIMLQRWGFFDEESQFEVLAGQGGLTPQGLRGAVAWGKEGLSRQRTTAELRNWSIQRYGDLVLKNGLLIRMPWLMKADDEYIRWLDGYLGGVRSPNQIAMDETHVSQINVGRVADHKALPEYIERVKAGEMPVLRVQRQTYIDEAGNAQIELQRWQLVDRADEVWVNAGLAVRDVNQVKISWDYTDLQAAQPEQVVSGGRAAELAAARSRLPEDVRKHLFDGDQVSEAGMHIDPRLVKAKEMDKLREAMVSAMRRRLERYKKVGDIVDGDEWLAQEQLLFAYDVTDQLLMDPVWRGMLRGKPIVGSILHVWGQFWRMLVSWQPAFPIMNLIESFGYKRLYLTIYEGGGRPLSMESDGYRLVQSLRQIGAESESLFHLSGGSPWGRLRNSDVPHALRVRAGRETISQLPVRISKFGEDRLRLDFARRVAGDTYRASRRTGMSEENAAWLARHEANRLVESFFAITKGRGWELMLNELVPFFSYNFKNKTLALRMMWEHPAVLAHAERLRLAIEESNRQQWSEDHPDLPFPEGPSASWMWWKVGDDYYKIDLASFSDWTRAMSKLSSANQNALDWFNEFIRVPHPSQLGALAILTGGDTPWGKPGHIRELSVWADLFYYLRGEDYADPRDRRTLIQIISKLLFFKEFGYVSPIEIKQQTFFALKALNDDQARAYLDANPDLQIYWDSIRPFRRGRITGFDDSISIHYRQLMSDEQNQELDEAYAAFDRLNDYWDERVAQYAAQPWSEEYKAAKKEAYLVRRAFLAANPIITRAWGTFMSPEEFAEQNDRFLVDRLADAWFNWRRPVREDFANELAFQKALVEHNERQAQFLKANPALMRRLEEGRTAVEAAWRGQELHWTEVLDFQARLKIRILEQEALGDDADRDVIDLLYRARDIASMDLDAARYGIFESPSQPGGARKIFAALPGLDTFRRARATPAEIAEMDRNEWYAKGLKAIGDAVDLVPQDQRGKEFYRLLALDPKLMAEYWARNPDKKAVYDANGEYIRWIGSWARNLEGRNFAAAQQVWDQMPAWVKERYFAKHPDSKMRDGMGGGGTAVQYKGQWFKSPESRDRYIMFVEGQGASTAVEYNGKWFKSPESRDRYIAFIENGGSEGAFPEPFAETNGSGFRSPESRQRFLDGQAYFASISRWVDLLKAKDFVAAERHFRAMPEWMQEKYYAKHPDQRAKNELDLQALRHGAEYFLATGDDKLKILARYPQLRQWLADNGGDEGAMRGLLNAMYRAIPSSEPWLKRTFRERFPEVFSQEAAGDRRIASVAKELAANPEMLPFFERALKLQSQLFMEQLKRSGVPPKPWTMERKSRLKKRTKRRAARMHSHWSLHRDARRY